MMGQRAALQISAIFLATISITALVPLAVLIAEFGGRTFCDETAWSFIAKLYGSYFLFPIFGAIAALFLVAPLAVTLTILQNNRRIGVYLAAFWVLFIVAVSAIELRTPVNAAFEIAPEQFSTPQGKGIYAKLETFCAAKPEAFAYRDNFLAYQKDLWNLIGQRRSWSGYVYFLAVPAQVGLHATLLSLFFLIIYLKKPNIDSYLGSQRSRWVRANFYLSFGLALIIGAIWCIYRLCYRIDHAAAFGGLLGNNPLFADYLVFAIYFIVVTFYIMLVGFDLEKIAKTTSQVATAVGVAGFSVAAPIGFTSNFFGTKASAGNFIGVLIVLLLLILLGLLFNTAPRVKPPRRSRNG